MIEAAGGIDVLAKPGDHSEVVTWDEVRAAEPDVVVVMPCGYYLDQALAEAEKYGTELAGLGATAIHAVDAAASFSRPGPRLADGTELLAATLHPDADVPSTPLRSAPVPLPL
jgi:iron complex transport system substrate-binding protein